MSIFHLDDLSNLQRLVAEIIIEVVVDTCPSGTYKFSLADLYTRRGRVEEHSDAQDIEALIRGTVYVLRDTHQLLENDENEGSYKLIKGRLLFYHVREKRLRLAIERISQELEDAKQELNVTL